MQKKMTLYDYKRGNLLICFDCGESANQCTCKESHLDNDLPSYVSEFE